MDFDDQVDPVEEDEEVLPKVPLDSDEEETDEEDVGLSGVEEEDEM